MSSATPRRSPAIFRQQARGFRHLDPRSLIVILLSTALVSGPGCTTTRAIDPQNQSAAKAGLKPGDTVRATLRDGRELELIFVEETVDQIVGRDRTDSLRTISRQDILSLEVTNFSPARTVLLVGGILLVYGVAAYAAGSLFYRMALPL